MAGISFQMEHHFLSPHILYVPKQRDFQSRAKEDLDFDLHLMCAYISTYESLSILHSTYSHLAYIDTFFLNLFYRHYRKR